MQTNTFPPKAGGSGPFLRRFPRTFDDAVAACFFVVVAAMACLMPMQNDSWWHLRAGQEMWTRRFVMLTDEFSFTVSGARFPNHEWLSEVVFYAMYWIGGLPALTLFAGLCVTCALALSWRLMAGASVQRLFVVGLALVSIVPVWTVRPHIFTLLLVPLVVHLALARWYWPIPLVFVVWANLHGGVALGLVALGGALAGRAFIAGRSAARPLFWTLLASFAATWMTPLGGSLWLTIPESIHKSSMNQIVEWRPPSLGEPTYLAFWIAAALLVVTTWRSRHRIRGDRHAVLLGVSLVLLALALRARRNVPPFLLLAVPALTYNLSDALSRWTSERAEDAARRWKINGGILVATICMCVALVARAWSGPAQRLQWEPIPQRVIDDVQACGDRVFNQYPAGGPLIWFAPRVRVFIDSRQDPYPLAFTQEYIELERTGHYEAMFARYGIRCAVLPGTALVGKRLIEDGWRIRVAQDGWFVLESSAVPSG